MQNFVALLKSLKFINKNYVQLYIIRDENKWWSNYHYLVVKNYGKMVIFVKKYVKMLKSKKFYLLKFRLTWPIEQVRT